MMFLAMTERLNRALSRTRPSRSGCNRAASRTHAFRLAALVLVLFTLATHSAETPANWPQFRGPGAMGVADHPGLPDRWSTNENVAWKVEVAGLGWSSPIAWGNRVFVTTVVSEGEMEEPKKGLYFGGERKELPKGTQRWLVLCLDLDSGREQWRHEVHSGAAPNRLHVKNTFASETPVTDGERVYAYFGNIGLFCFDAAGKRLWSMDWPPVKTRNGWGSAASPVLHRDRVYIVNDNDEKSFVVAIDTKAGRPLW